MSDDNVINFYSVNDEYGEFSNFAPYSIRLKGKLVEHTTNDAYWGDGGDGSGTNMLGRILMEVRERLRAE